MKHISLWLIAALTCLQSLQAQNTTLQTFFHQHKEKPGFTHALLSKDLFDVASGHEISKEDWQGLHAVVQNMGVMEILVADSISNGVALYKEAKSCIQETEFDELLTVRDNQTNVRIWVKSEEDIVTDLVLLVGAPEEFVLICFAGKLELGNISQLPELFEAGKTTQFVERSAEVSAAFSISPNPARDQISIQFSDPQDQPSQLEIIDINGRKVLQTTLSSDATLPIQIGQLKPGTYWVQLRTTGGKIGIQQLVKMSE
ncbi:MAG TPA: DUF4252 domain-containing protein [Saprospiraceae bacterium]|nr:DUF4252 domain-containing protein [Saprospiraceae bacterium]